MSKIVEIATLPDGRGAIHVGGIDLSEYVSGFRIDCKAGEGTQITLDLRPGLSLDYTGDAGVEVVRGMLVQQGACICEEVFPELGKHGGLKIDPACPSHGYPKKERS